MGLSIHHQGDKLGMRAQKTRQSAAADRHDYSPPASPPSWGSRATRCGATPERSQSPQGPKAATDRLHAGEAVTERAKALFEKEAAGNAVVVQRLLAQEGVSCSLPTTQRVLLPVRAALWRAQGATVRFETAPGKQMRLGFGQEKEELSLNRCARRQSNRAQRVA
jgi:hypothetical protein